jgi:hypothetical protein
MALEAVLVYELPLIPSTDTLTDLFLIYCSSTIMGM